MKFSTLSLLIVLYNYNLRVIFFPSKNIVKNFRPNVNYKELCWANVLRINQHHVWYRTINQCTADVRRMNTGSLRDTISSEMIHNENRSLTKSMAKRVAVKISVARLNVNVAAQRKLWFALR